MTNMTHEVDRQTINKIFLKLMPLLMIGAIVAYLDRVNVGFAALTMNQDLGISASSFGLGAGLFFIGYFIFEVPSNMLLEKFGPRLWLARIMLTWGIIAVGFGFIHGVNGFYIMRVLLGIAEAGFSPGVMLLLTYWFPARSRARAISLFISAVYFGGVIGAPLSGLILTYCNGLMGLAGWRWMFILEGIPAILLAYFYIRYLDNSPREAAWLTNKEKEEVINVIEKENRAKREIEHVSVWKALTNPLTLLMAGSYFLVLVGMFAMNMWIPLIIKELGNNLSTMTISLYSMLPSLVIVVSMLAFAHHSDKTGERRWHYTAAILIGAVGFLIAAGNHGFAISLFGLLTVGFGIGGFTPTFWGYATETLGAKEAAVGIALINATANLGGFFGPSIMGFVKDFTGDFFAGFYFLAGCFVLTAIVMQIVHKMRMKKAPSLPSSAS